MKDVKVLRFFRQSKHGTTFSLLRAKFACNLSGLSRATNIVIVTQCRLVEAKQYLSDDSSPKLSLILLICGLSCSKTRRQFIRN